MSLKALTRRSREVLVGTKRIDRGELGKGARKYYYERLARVELEHTYFTDSGGHRPAFELRPTPATADLLSNLGLLFRQDETGFSILYNVKSKDALFNFLRRQRLDSPSRTDEDSPCWKQQEAAAARGVWTRMSFVLAFTNPRFINYTEIPIDTNPAEKNFFFTNLNAHTGPRDTVFLTPPGRTRVSGADLLPVVPSQIVVDFCPGAEQLWVRSLSGEVVLCLPRCFKFEGLTSINEITCGHAVPCDQASLRRDEVYVDFFKLKEDKYRLEQVDAACQPITNRGGGDRCTPTPWEVLYTELYPMPMCFIDLLFTRPNDQEPGVYPVRDLFTVDPKNPSNYSTYVKEVDYVLRFVRRETWWSYYIVPQARRQPLPNLRIESVDKGEKIPFAGPCRVRLANGSVAYRFVSRQPLALEYQSKYHFRLYDDQAGNPRILMDRLPVASDSQVLPLSPDRACASLEKSLLDPNPPRGGCKQLQSEVCDALHERNYSDIYVYI